MKLFEAFEALEALNEETFAVSEDGVEKLDTFMQDNEDIDDTVDVIDLEAETEEELEDSYVGKVILDCSVCHSKIYKDKTDVTVDEEQQLANVGEECPYCYTSDGFKIIGEVASFADNVEEPKDVEEESLTEAVGTLERPLSALGGTLSNVMTAHQGELASIGSKDEALAFLDSIESEVKNKGYLATVREKVAKLPDFKVLTFLYNIILKGDGMGKLESLTESHRGDRHRVTAELFDVLSENGFDTDAEDVEDYVFAARDLVFEDLLANPDMSISEIVSRWYEETRVNYPEDLEALTKLDYEDNLDEGIFGNKYKGKDFLVCRADGKDEAIAIADDIRNLNIFRKAHAKKNGYKESDYAIVSSAGNAVKTYKKSLKSAVDVTSELPDWVEQSAKEDTEKHRQEYRNAELRKEREEEAKRKAARDKYNSSTKDPDDDYIYVKGNGNGTYKYRESLELEDEELDEGIFGKKKNKKHTSSNGKNSEEVRKVDISIYDENGSKVYSHTFEELPGKMRAEDQLNELIKSNGVLRQYKASPNKYDWIYERKSTPPCGLDTDRYRNPASRIIKEDLEEGIFGKKKSKKTSQPVSTVKPRQWELFDIITHQTTGQKYDNRYEAERDAAEREKQTGHVCRVQLVESKSINEEFSHELIKEETIYLPTINGKLDIHVMFISESFDGEETQYAIDIDWGPASNIADKIAQAIWKYSYGDVRVISTSTGAEIHRDRFVDSLCTWDDEEYEVIEELYDDVVDALMHIDTDELSESKSIEEEYAIFINNEVHCNDDGEPFHFNSHTEAQKFIEENELENAEVVRQYGKAINEDVNNISLDTDDSHVEVNTDENGKLTVTTEPIQQEETTDEVIVPVSDETKSEIENNDIEDSEAVEGEEDINPEEFDEESFDELGESYFKQSFDNVVAFRTKDVTMSGNNLIVEGHIKFDSGNVKKTSFTFTAKDFLKEGIYRLVGKNNQIVESGLFELVGRIKDTKFICESLTEVR